MAGFQRGDDALGVAEVVEGVERLLVGDAHVLGAADFLQPGVLGAHAGVVQASADRMGFGDLAVVVLQDVGAVAMQHTRGATLQRRRVLAAVQALAGGFDADQARVLEGDIGVENPHRIAAAAHAGDHGIGLLGSHVLLLEQRRHLGQALIADHALKSRTIIG